jgi:hypothetical protein
MGDDPKLRVVPAEPEPAGPIAIAKPAAFSLDNFRSKLDTAVTGVSSACMMVAHICFATGASLRSSPSASSYDSAVARRVWFGAAARHRARYVVRGLQRLGGDGLLAASA